jgi:hypothetical protein
MPENAFLHSANLSSVATTTLPKKLRNFLFNIHQVKKFDNMVSFPLFLAVKE